MSILKKAFAHWTQSKNPDSPRYRRAMAERINGQYIKYITEKRGDNEDVIGRSGSLSIKRGQGKGGRDEFIVSSSAGTILRCYIEDLQAWELMSHDGVVITAPDLEHGGTERTIIVHYVYYRK